MGTVPSKTVAPEPIPVADGDDVLNFLGFPGIETFFRPTPPTEERKLLLTKIKSIETADELDSYLSDNEDTITDVYRIHAPRMDITWLRVFNKHQDLLTLLPLKIGGPSSGVDLLHSVAAAQGHVDVILYLLNEVQGFDVNGKYGGSFTMLHVASFSGKIDIVRLLLGKDADLNIRDNLNRSAGEFAIMGGDVSVIDLLYLAGVTFEEDITRTTTVGSRAALVHLFDLGVFRHNMRLLFSCGVFFRLYDALRLRATVENSESSSIVKNSTKDFYRLLASVLEAAGAAEEKAFQCTLVTHFMMQFLKEQDDELRAVLLPYLDIFAEPRDGGKRKHLKKFRRRQ